MKLKQLPIILVVRVSDIPLVRLDLAWNIPNNDGFIVLYFHLVLPWENTSTDGKRIVMVYRSSNPPSSWICQERYITATGSVTTVIDFLEIWEKLCRSYENLDKQQTAQICHWKRESAIGQWTYKFNVMYCNWKSRQHVSLYHWEWNKVFFFFIFYQQQFISSLTNLSDLAGCR